MGQSLKMRILLSITAITLAGFSQKVDVSGEKSPDSAVAPVKTGIKTSKPNQPAFRIAPAGEGTSMK